MIQFVTCSKGPRLPTVSSFIKTSFCVAFEISLSYRQTYKTCRQKAYPLIHNNRCLSMCITLILVSKSVNILLQLAAKKPNQLNQAPVEASFLVCYRNSVTYLFTYLLTSCVRVWQFYNISSACRRCNSDFLYEINDVYFSASYDKVTYLESLPKRLFWVILNTH